MDDLKPYVDAHERLNLSIDEAVQFCLTKIEPSNVEALKASMKHQLTTGTVTDFSARVYRSIMDQL